MEKHEAINRVSFRSHKSEHRHRNGSDHRHKPRTANIGVQCRRDKALSRTVSIMQESGEVQQAAAATPIEAKVSRRERERESRLIRLALLQYLVFELAPGDVQDECWR